MRSAREALTASRRAPLLSALGVVTIAFSLFAFGLFGLVAINIRKALERARKEMGEFADVFEAGVLPASIEVHLRPGMRSPAIVKSVADRMKTYQFIDDVRYGEEWVAKLYRLRKISTVAGIALGVAFAAVPIIIIGATIRMTVLARAKEISIMRLA